MKTEALMQQDGQFMAELAGKYLTFRLAGEDFGLGILKVQEIIGIQEITAIPRTPPFVRGVINLRGKVIPVIDLRLRFGMESTEVSRKTCIIVVQVSKGSDDVIMGIVVDEVSEVLEIAGSEIEPPPGFGAQIETDFILGMAKAEDAVKILLDINRVLTENEITKITGENLS